MIAPVNLLLFGCLALCGSVKADYTFQVKVVSYENPTGRSDQDGSCCDSVLGIDICTSSCHPYYQEFCLKHFQSDLSDCSLGSTTGDLEFDNDEVVSISGVGAWPGSFTLSFEIWDNDGVFNNHIIATVNKDVDEDHPVGDSGDPFSDPVTVTGNYYTLEFQFRVFCDPGFNGNQCECSGCCDDQWECDSGQCIPASERCDGTTGDCADGSDEDDTCPFSCGANEFDCGGGECIPSSKKCDGTMDCSNGLDETSGCQTSTNPTSTISGGVTTASVYGGSVMLVLATAAFTTY